MNIHFVRSNNWMIDMMTMTINNRCAHLLAFGWFEANMAPTYPPIVCAIAMMIPASQSTIPMKAKIARAIKV